MKVFEVEYTSNGRKQKMTLKAQSASEARRNASKMKGAGSIVKVGETKSLPLEVHLENLKDRISTFSGRVKVKIPNLVTSIRQLSVMTNAGISIHDSVKEVAAASSDKRLQTIFENINNDLNSGMSLTESASVYKDELGDMTISMIKLGEETGNMAESLQKLAEILEEVWDNQQKFKKAIRYPISVVVAIAIAFTILMLVVVPKFKEIFEQLNATLPVPTKILLAIEHILSNFGILVLAAIFGTIFMLKRLYRLSPEFKLKFDTYVLKIYLIGKIVFFSSMSRFNLIFTELIKSGIPIADALDTACLTVSNQHIKDKLSGVKIAVQRGVSLTEAFRDTELYEGMLIQMISAGEKSGSLDNMLSKVTDYYREKFADIIDNLSSYIEPILIGFIAVMVIFLALGIFMPMWDMAQAVKS